MTLPDALWSKDGLIGYTDGHVSYTRCSEKGALPMSLFKMVQQLSGLMLADRATRRRFERMAQDATDHGRIVTTLSILYDIRPSEARARFDKFCSGSVCDFRECGRQLITMTAPLPELD
uniref:Uncharacterized protein n=1 Tax=viral metagenome TaxID=1070528 RepID=A0A6M3LRG1_9ZZZZ